MKKFLLLWLSVFLFANNLSAQHAPSWAWASKPTCYPWANSWSIATDAWGNVIVTGGFSGNLQVGGDLLACNGAENTFIAKYDANGNAVWGRAIGGSLNYALAITADKNGGIVVTGSFANSINAGGTILKSVGSQDIFIAKYDANGNVSWVKAAGGQYVDGATDIVSDVDGAVVVCGLFASQAPPNVSDTASFGSITLTSDGSDNAFVAKYDTDGSLVWAKAAGGSSYTDALYLSLDKGGNAFVMGIYADTAYFDSDTLITRGSNDIFIAKYNKATGHEHWVRSVGGDEGDLVGGMASDGDNVYITGNFFSSKIYFGGLTLDQTSNPALFLAGYDSSGAVLWAKRMISFNTNTANAGSSGLIADNASNIFMVGNAHDDIVLANDTLRVADGQLFVAKYDAQGNEVWGVRGGNGTASGIALSNNSDILITGNFDEPSATFGTNSLFNNGNGNMFIAKLPFAATRVKEHNTAENALEISPNPSTGIVYFAQSSNQYYQVSVTDQLGRQVYQSSDTHSADLAQLPAGIYHVRLLGKGNTLTGTLVISR